jgi:hypothetical protein
MVAADLCLLLEIPLLRRHHPRLQKTQRTIIVAVDRKPIFYPSSKRVELS